MSIAGRYAMLARQLLHEAVDDLEAGGKSELQQLIASHGNVVGSRRALTWAVQQGYAREDRRPVLDGGPVLRIYPTEKGFVWLGRRPVPLPAPAAERACLACGRVFLSDGPHHRLCQRHRGGEMPENRPARPQARRRAA